MFEVWWCETYNQPPNHPLLKEVSEFELMLQFYVWFVRNKPEEANRIRLSNVQGNTQVVTGDGPVDELERKLANDEPIPDLVNALVHPSDRESVRAFLAERALESLLPQEGTTHPMNGEKTSPSPGVPSGASGFIPE